MGFAERMGFKPVKPIQIESLDEQLRNRLFNIIQMKLSDLTNNKELNAINYVLDKIGLALWDDTSNYKAFFNILLGLSDQRTWYEPYEVVEYLLEYFALHFRCYECFFDKCPHPSCYDSKRKADFCNSINSILEEEKSGYRLLDGKFVPITDQKELAAIQDSMELPVSSASTHIKKALALYADREKPDYENSIKESISAVESMCCYITNLTGSNATLGAALKKLEDNGVVIHGAMKSAFEKLYGYTSDADGIRHGGIDFTNAPAEDAKYMLVTCSAFVNYLQEKLCKLGGTP